MRGVIYTGVLGNLYRVKGKLVEVSTDNGKSWSVSAYGSNIPFFLDGIDRGYLWVA